MTIWVYCLSAAAFCQQPFLLSTGGGFESDGSQTIHLAIGETVVGVYDGEQYLGLGFLHALSLSIPCESEDYDCICLRQPHLAICGQGTLQHLDFLIDNFYTALPPPGLIINGSFELHVFSRTGKLEFSTSRSGPIDRYMGMDGVNKPLPNGVYYYVLEHDDCPRGRCKGSLTIWRD